MERRTSMVKSRRIVRREAARRAAVSVMRLLGYQEAHEADTVIWSSQAMALVHAGPRPATVRQVEWIFILAGRLAQQPLVISASGFSKEAVELAERYAVATFALAERGPAVACDSLGMILLANAERRAEGKLRPFELATAAIPG
jgi:hypothetical protein